MNDRFMWLKERMKVKKVAYYAMLTALCVILGYVESLFPVFIAVPGVKLGLTNIAVLTALCLLGDDAAISVNVARIIVSGFLFGTGSAILYSLSGGILSVAVMVFLKKMRFKIVTVSIMGGVSHNIGQIVVAMILLKTGSLLSYLVYLWFFGMAAGMLTGITGGILVERLKTYKMDRQADL